MNDQSRCTRRPWCGYCRRLKSQLEREGIGFAEVDIEQVPEAADYVMSVNGGNQTVPTVVVVAPGGEKVAMTNPSLAQSEGSRRNLSRPVPAECASSLPPGSHRLLGRRLASQCLGSARSTSIPWRQAGGAAWRHRILRALRRATAGAA